LKKILLQGVLLAAVLVFLFKGGMRLLLVGWRIFVPMLAVTIIYFAIRHLLQKKKVGAKSNPDSLGSGQPITICPHCHKPKGSCPKCQD
jgi:hypothetical protein